MSDDEFMTRGLCAQTDPEAFFPAKGAPTTAAKRICQGCDVRAECLAYALANGEQFGVWGGLSERERRKLRRARDLPTRKQLQIAEQRATARRMYAAGSSRADIVRALHTNYERVNAYLTEASSGDPATTGAK